MTRLVGPDQRIVYKLVGRALHGVPNKVATVYADEAGTTVADIITYPGGQVIAGSQLTLDEYSRLPLFQFPDAVDTVYARIENGPIVPIYARVDDRLDRVTVTVRPATAPTAPTDVSAVAGNTSATVSWAASDASHAVTSYTVAAAPGGVTATTSGTSLTVPGLSNGTAYTFTVTATNSAGTSSASEASNPVGPSPQPGDLVIPDLIAWWKADSLTGYSDGQQIIGWDDSSGNGHPANVGAPATRPQYKASWRNGKPATQYNGTGYTFGTLLTQRRIGPAMTWFVVGELTAATSGGNPDQRVFSDQTSTSDGHAANLDTYAASGNAWRVFAAAGSHVAPAAALNTPSIVSAVFGGGKIYVNGDDGGGYISYGQDRDHWFWIGSMAGSDRFFTGYISEIIVYRRKLTATERHQVEAYLSVKYNITVVAE